MTGQLHLDGQPQSERVCACPCERSLDGMRKDAVWYSRACAVSCRSHPGRSLKEAHSANRGRTRKRRTPAERGVQVSVPKVLRELAKLKGGGGLILATPEEVVAAVIRAVPQRQREILEQREAA